MIRPAVIKDVSEIVRLCKEFYDEMEYAKLGHPFDDATAARTCEAWIESMDALVLVAEDEETRARVGVGAMILVPGLMDGNERKAVEAVWHTDPNLGIIARAKHFIALFEAMESWAEHKGARTIHFSTAVSKGETVDEFLCREGYTLREHHYGKEL